MKNIHKALFYLAEGKDFEVGGNIDETASLKVDDVELYNEDVKELIGMLVQLCGKEKLSYPAKNLIRAGLIKADADIKELKKRVEQIDTDRRLYMPD